MHGELKPFSVSGRIGRLRYLARSLVVVLASAGLFGIAGIIMAISSIAGVICMGLIFIGMLVVNVQIGVQRLHDFGWSGWLLLLNLGASRRHDLPLRHDARAGKQRRQSIRLATAPNSLSVKILATLWLLVILIGVAAALTVPTLVDLRQSAF